MGGGFVVGAAAFDAALGYEAVFVVVGIEVAFAVAELFGTGVVAVAEVLGDGESAAGFDVLQGGVDAGVGAVAFGSGGDVNSGVGEGDAGFGHSDEFGGLMGGHGDAEGVAVGEANVFAGGDDDAARDEADVLPCVKHFGEPVEGGVGVGGAHALYKGADGVVMGVAIAIIDDGFLLDGLLGDLEGDVDDAAGVGGGGEGGEFEGVQGLARVAIGDGGEVGGGVGVEVDVEEAEAAFFVGEGSLHDGEEVVLGEGFEGEDLGAGDEGAVDVKEGVVGGGADEAEGAAFDVG